MSGAAAVWLCVAVIDVALSASIAGAVLRSSELSLAAGISLAAGNVLLLALVVAAAATARRLVGAWAWPIIAAKVFL